MRAKFPGNDARIARLSLIDESGGRYVRMANLAVVGSHAVNGVAELHSELLKQTVLRDFAELWPEKFCNVTNGVTPRRFVALSNPKLSELITKRIGDSWLKNLDRLRDLEKFADEEQFQQEWRKVKLANKRVSAALIEERTGIMVVARIAFRHPGEADPRIQAPAPRSPAHSHSVSSTAARPERGRAGPHLSSSAAKRPPVISWPSASSS